MSNTNYVFTPPCSMLPFACHFNYMQITLLHAIVNDKYLLPFHWSHMNFWAAFDLTCLRSKKSLNHIAPPSICLLNSIYGPNVVTQNAQSFICLVTAQQNCRAKQKKKQILHNFDYTVLLCCIPCFPAKHRQTMILCTWWKWSDNVWKYSKPQTSK